MTLDARLLILLDDAETEAQIAPLLPAGHRCAVLITGRRPLPSLAPDAVAVTVLHRSYALTLLSRIIGAERVARETTAADTITHCCAGLPLAIRIAGARLATRPRWRLAMFADRLADERRRLDELAVGDLGVRTTLEVSYAELDDLSGHALRHIAQLAAQPIGVWAVAAALDLTDEATSRITDHLVDLQLCTVDEHDRLSMHALLRTFLQQREADLPESEKTAAMTRAVGAWLALAERADAHLPAGRGSRADGRTLRHRPVEQVVERVAEDPRAWFATEQDNVIALLEQIAARPDPGQSADAGWELVEAYSGYLEVWGSPSTWRRMAELALRTAADDHARAHAYRGLGDAFADGDLIREARECYTRSLDGFRRLAEPLAEARVAGNFAMVALAEGHLDEAAELAEHSRTLLEALGDHRALGYTLHRLGMLAVRTSRPDLAEQQFTAAIGQFRQLSDRYGEHLSLLSLGEVYRNRGDHDHAMRTLLLARDIAEQLDQPRGEAYVWRALGRTHLQAARHLDAEVAFHHSLDLAERVGDETCRALVEQSLGELYLARGEPEAAIPVLERALEFFLNRGIVVWQQRTRLRLDQAHKARDSTASL